jgi:hypothetical protein
LYIDIENRLQLTVQNGPRQDESSLGFDCLELLYRPLLKAYGNAVMPSLLPGSSAFGWSRNCTAPMKPMKEAERVASAHRTVASMYD